MFRRCGETSLLSGSKPNKELDIVRENFGRFVERRFEERFKNNFRVSSRLNRPGPNMGISRFGVSALAAVEQQLTVASGKTASFPNPNH